MLIIKNAFANKILPKLFRFFCERLACLRCNLQIEDRVSLKIQLKKKY